MREAAARRSRSRRRAGPRARAVPRGASERPAAGVRIVSRRAVVPRGVFSGAQAPPRHRYANFKPIRSMLRAIFASRVAPAMENAGGTESIDKYRTARRTFESCGELGAVYLRGVERGLPVVPRCRLARYASTGILEHLHTVLAQRADAGLLTASAAPAVPAAKYLTETSSVSHGQVDQSWRLAALEPPPMSPDQEEFIRGCRDSPDAQPRSNSSKVHLDDGVGPASTDRVHGHVGHGAHGVDGVSRGVGGLFGHGVRRRGALAPAVGSEIWYWWQTRP